MKSQPCPKQILQGLFLPESFCSPNKTETKIHAQISDSNLFCFIIMSEARMKWRLYPYIRGKTRVTYRIHLWFTSDSSGCTKVKWKLNLVLNRFSKVFFCLRVFALLTKLKQRFTFKSRTQIYFALLLWVKLGWNGVYPRISEVKLGWCIIFTSDWHPILRDVQKSNENTQFEESWTKFLKGTISIETLFYIEKVYFFCVVQDCNNINQVPLWTL